MSPLASAAASGGSGDGFSMLLLLLPLLLIAFLFWSQRNRQKKFKEMQSDLQVGSRVMTTTGLYGTIAQMDDNTVQVEAAPGVVLQFDRRVVMQAPGAQPPHAQPETDNTTGEQ
ncbi:preprotein translocase subunit YajC [Ornithinimicrobium faecis]|uniref:Preprotein translocase subunit YajC n=1 Tax=Ornithinimicrobium faecis TaxID=2934158 RepID=A0ABY4YZ52_9MICO|nr:MULTISPECIES: preprotein translocase subunit YajC [unclassified Ornithinimicrobium]USQ82015.1 preprotein translocase subunit YajC [Ornithinimicrobium sp. HY1793]